MSSSQFSRWLWVVLLVGCNAKLQVDPAASGGDGGTSGRGIAGAMGAGRGPIDEQAGESAGGGDVGGGGEVAGGDVGGGCDFGCGGFQPSGGTGGAQPLGPTPGQHEQACIPAGTTVEADGSPAKTSVTTLDRCDNGLVCDATKRCTAIPACPQSTGPCVVHGVPLEDPSTGGTNGGGGAGGGPPSTGGFGQALVAAEVGVTAMAADDTHLYWIEYGTRDGLGNYQHDGALFSYAFADSKTTTIASDLPGPNGLGVTSGHAYVVVDGAPLVGNAAKYQLLRLPLTGGASELVQDAVAPTALASFGDQAFWATNTGLYTALPTPGASVSTLYADYSVLIAADASFVYASNFKNIFSVPQAGNTATVLVSPGYTFALGADSLYGIEQLGDVDGLILDFAPKTGGTWERKRALGFGGFADRLQVIGDRFFFSAPPDSVSNAGPDYTKEYIETGLISSSAAPLRLVEKAALSLSQRMLWTGTATAVFWSDGSAIFTRAITGN